ncbi:MAG: ABC transporter ATP-binding protein [Bacteroidia bacterium]|nr:ABC transporter ATP-binding protein [Bacteroidia bacterium]
MSTPLIVVEDVSKRYKNAEDLSLQQVSFTIFQGDRFGVLGPNGAGKTTLISILCGIMHQSSGKVTFCSSGLKHGIVGFVPQDFAFYNELTAAQNLEYFGALCNLSRKEIEESSDNVLTLLGLLNVANKKVKTFSGGMKRRLNLAIGILHNPSVLFLDEPTVGVDIQSKNAIIQFLIKLNQQGTTIIYTSHHLAEAEEFCNKVAILDYGKLIAFDQVSALKQTHEAGTLTDVILKLTGEGYRDHV